MESEASAVVASSALLSGLSKVDAIKNLSIIRKVLSTPNPPINAVIQTGVTTLLLKYLSHEFDNDSEIQFEASWCILNIVGGTTHDCEHIIQSGGITALTRLLESTSDFNVQENVSWALGNIAGDSAKSRDLVLQAGVFSTLLRTLNPEAMTESPPPISLRRTMAWVVSNLIRGKKGSKPNHHSISDALPILAGLITAAKLDPSAHFDEELITDVVWTLSYLSETPTGIEETNKHICWFISGGENKETGQQMCRYLVELIQVYASNQNSKILAPAVRCLGNLLTGGAAETQAVLDMGVLDAFRAVLLATKKNSIIKDVVWAISNITAGTIQQIAAVGDSGVLGSIIEILNGRQITGPERRIATEALWVLCNAIDGTESDTKFLSTILSANPGAEAALIKVLEECGEVKFALMAAQALEKILNRSDAAISLSTAHVIMGVKSRVGKRGLAKKVDRNSHRGHKIQLELFRRYEGSSAETLHKCWERVLEHKTMKGACSSPSKIGVNPDPDVASDSEDEDIPTIPKMRHAKRIASIIVTATTDPRFLSRDVAHKVASFLPLENVADNRITGIIPASA